MATALLWLGIPTMKERLVSLMGKKKRMRDLWLTSSQNVRPSERLLFFAEAMESDTVEARQEQAWW